MFLSNWLVFKIVLAAVTGLVDYPLAADVLLVYDNANKLYLEGNSIDYVSNVVLYKGETSYEIPQYPRIDFNNETKLTGETSTGNFGSSVSIDGDYLAITDSFYDSSDNGKIYIYHRSGTTWSLQNSFQSATSSDYMEAVAISGDYVMAGVRYGDDAGANAGEVLVYKRYGTTWTNTQTLTASDATAGDHFGSSITIKGNYAVVGTGQVSGAYIFTLSNGTWSETQLLTTGTDSDLFGCFVKLSDTDLLIGARGVNSLNGTAYIYTNNGGTFTQQVQITPDDLVGTDWFGQYGDIFGDYACVGAPYQNSDTGAAYIFKRSGTTWTQQQKLTASNAATNTKFGGNIHFMSDDTLIIGAYEDDAKGSQAGAAYLFQRSGDTWSEIKIIYPSDIGANDYFGVSISSSETDLVISGPTQNNAAGTVYVYPHTKTRNYYITQPGTYRADLQICGIDYKTNEVEVTGTPTSSKVTQISTGGNVSLALTQDGFVYAWGEDTYGQMGQGTTDTNVNTPVKVKGVGGSGFLSNITKISCGGRHCIALASDGTLYAWGDNTEGQIGDASNTERKTPVTVSYSGDPVSNISAGFLHSALTTTTGKVYCWGQGTNGQIGDNQSSSDRTSPVQVVGVGNSGTLTGIRDVTCGDAFTHAIKDSDGSVYGWGKQLYGIIGNGQNSGDALTPTSVILASDSSAVTGITQISGGGDSSLMLKSDGTVYACGYNGLGQIGNGTITDADSGLVQVQGVGGSGYLTGITQIAIAYASSLALKSDGTMYSWGNNYDGQNGLGTVGGTNPTTPVAITLLTDVDTINTGGKPSHFIVTKLDGSVFCWGRGDEGQIGDGTNTADQGTPTQVLAGAGPSVDGKFNLLIEPRLTFDNYNKFSILHGLSSVSSKLTYGSNVYDIGTLTSDITIEKPGEYASLTFDTSSNVAYFSNATVGAIGSTQKDYEVEQILYGTHDSDSPSQGGFGHYIDTNGDGTRFVLGMGMDPTTGQYDGRVKVYHLESGTWTLKVDIPTPNTGSTRFGDSVCMNEDGTRIVVNHYPSDVTTSRAYIYDYASGAWPTTPTATIIGNVTGAFGEGDMDMNKAGTVIVFGSRAYGTQIWSRAGDGTWSETKNWGNGFGGYGVAINGAGTRIVTGKESTGEIFEGNYVGGSWGSLTSVIDTSYTSWPAKIRMDSDGTTLIVNADPATEAGIYERQSGTSWTLSQSILSMASYYSRNGLSISYDGNMVLVGDMTNDTDGNNFGRAFLWNKSGGSWSLTKTFSNPKASPAVNDYWGAGVAIAKNTKDRIMIGMSADSTAGNEYGSVYVHTNAIPDFIDFDGYNKLSLSGLTNPTSKIHALPTGAETTTVYDIGTATNIYIESEGTYTAEMKSATKFVLDSNVTGNLGTYLTLHDNVAISHTTGGGDTTVTVNNIKGNMTYKIYFNKQWTDSHAAYKTRFGLKIKDSSDVVIRDMNAFADYRNNPRDGLLLYDGGYDGGGSFDEGAMTIADGFVTDGGAGSVTVEIDGGTYGSTSSPFTLADSFYVVLTMSTSDVITGKFFVGDTEVVTYFLTNRQSNTGTIGETGNKFEFRFWDTATISGVNMTVEEYNPAPKLTHDTYNKLSIENITPTASTLRLGSNTYDIGTATDIYIEDTGTYEIETKDANTFALVSNTALNVTEYSSSVLDTVIFSKISGSSWTQNSLITDIQLKDADDNLLTIEYFYFPNSNGGDGRNLEYINSSSGTLFSNVTDGSYSSVDPSNGEYAYRNTPQTDRILAFLSSTFNGYADGTEIMHVKVVSGEIAKVRVVWDRQLYKQPMRISNNGKTYDITVGSNSYQGLDETYTLGGTYNATSFISFDTYNKLSIENITPTASTLRLGSNTYEIGTATDIYIEDTGTYEIETKDANTFAFASNVVSSVTRVEPVITGRHALTYDGKLYGWGENSNGELGVGDTTDKTVPTLCTGIPQGEIVSIWKQSIRGQSRWAKTRDGRIWVTGDHDSYCLPGSSSDFTTFTDVSADFGDYTQTSNNVVWASGSERATQVLMENGDVWSFGDDTGSLGVLGQGASPTSDRTPRKLNVSNITKITYGGDLVMALDSSNVVWMWGRNGTGNSTSGWGPYNVPTNIMSTGTNSLTSLLATDSETVVDIESSYYSMFALTDKGTVYCTGHNASGQLGQGNATAKTSSDGWVKIEYFTSNAITVNKLYVGGERPHVFADTSDGWYCWGENTTGELGLGDNTDKLSPVKFTGVSNIKKFGKGGGVSYAITEDGKYYAWGLGASYARGDNDTGAISYPKYIDTLPNILAPSFEFDGYDKVFVNYPEVYKYDFYINVLSDDNLVFHEINFKDSTGASIKPLSYDKYNEIPVASWATGDMSGLFDGSTTSPPDFGFYKSDSSVGDKMFYVILPKLASSVVISHARPKYTPGFKIKVGTSVVFSEDSNGGTGETPAPYSKTCTLSTNVSKSQYTKYTKDTHTYDTNQAQIVTVSDPGTYDAQIIP
jgi:alpha-tubulin suppressor-like RCC1 family protein